MKTIKETVTNTIIIDKSKFITYLIPINNKQDLQDSLASLKKQYPDATHICYASIYLENDLQCYKSSDDGEPSNTAKVPILNALKQNDLNNVLCAVIRYFGGIKLGAGGLCRAYGKSCLEAIKLATIVDMIYCDVYQFKVSYSMDKMISYALKNLDCIVFNKNYDIDVLYEVCFKNNDGLNQFKTNFNTLELKIINKVLVSR